MMRATMKQVRPSLVTGHGEGGGIMRELQECKGGFIVFEAFHKSVGALPEKCSEEGASGAQAPKAYLHI